MHFKILIPITFLFLTSFITKTHQAEKKTIMAIFAHPDDEITVSPLLTKYATEGHIVYLVIVTKGELGVTKHANLPAGDTLATIRAGEVACACEKLGIMPPILLGLGDGSLAKDFTGRPLHEKLDSIFKLYKPNIVITWGPDGGYGHMDHRIVHNIVTELFQSGQYSKPEQLFFTGIPTENWKQTPNFQTGNVKWMSDYWKPVKKEYLTVRIKYSKQDIANAEVAMQCHQSQFSKKQMEDIKLWMSNTNRDTVYFRPFIPQKKLSFNLFQ
jgi:LmbE family N-acetylglucosaminyl deacetylase